MSAPAFTPGPWHPGHLGQREGCQCAYVFSEGYHGSICTVSVGNDLPIGEGGNDAPTRSEAIGNMHLIAAAPEMFAALRMLLCVDFEHPTEHDDMLLESVLADARFAVHQASGGASS